MLIISYMGDQVWLITSRQTLPDLLIGKTHVSVNHGVNKAGAGIAGSCVQLVDVRVEDAVHEADAWALVGILIR